MTTVYMMALQSQGDSPNNGTLQVSPDDPNDGQIWLEQEPGSAQNVFITKGGKYLYKDGNTNLYTSDQSQRVGFLSAFNPSSASIGQNGTGSCDETAVAFSWTVADIIKR